MNIKIIGETCFICLKYEILRLNQHDFIIKVVFVFLIVYLSCPKTHFKGMKVISHLKPKGSKEHELKAQ